MKMELTFREEGGVQRIYSFHNGYSVSALMTPFSYGGKQGLWEAGIMKKDCQDEWSMVYTTPLTNDVVGGLTDAELADFVNAVRSLPFAR